MSVPASQRKEAETKFYVHAYNMYDEIMKFLMKDFGTKRVKDYKMFLNRLKVTKEDKAMFDELSRKYGFEVEMCYPAWVLEEFRKTIFEALNKLLYEVTSAYTIYPNTLYECNLKREHQWNAISLCQYIKQVLQRVINIFCNKPDIEKYMVYIEMIDEEVRLLKSWKKSENKIRRKCIENEVEIYNGKNNSPEYNKLIKEKVTVDKIIKKEEIKEKESNNEIKDAIIFIDNISNKAS